MSNPNVIPNNFSGAIKTFRRRVSTLPIPSQLHALRGAMIQLCDDVLLQLGDEFKEDFAVGPLPGSSPSTPLDMSPNVRHMPGITSHVQPTQAAVVMVPAGQEPVAERPQIIQQPVGTPPHVQLVDGPLPVVPPGGGSAAESPTGVTRIVKPGVDPIAAMDDPELSVPFNG
jgi:hypothetical protein